MPLDTNYSPVDDLRRDYPIAEKLGHESGKPYVSFAGVVSAM